MTERRAFPPGEMEVILKAVMALAADDSPAAEKRANRLLADYFNAEKLVVRSSRSQLEQSIGIDGARIVVHLPTVLAGTGQIVAYRADPPWTVTEGSALIRIGEKIAPFIAARKLRQKNKIQQRRKEADQLFKARQLSALTQGSPEMIYTADLNDTITTMNEAGAKLLGWDQPEDIVGRTFHDLALNREDRENLLRRLESEPQIANYEIILLKRDGTPLYCLESISAMQDARGKRVGIQGIVNDISARVGIELELWRTNMDLAELNQKLQMTQARMVQQEKLASIGQLAAGVAHEINNPLGFLKSNFETIEMIVGDFRAFLENSPADNTDETRFRQAFADLESIFKESGEGFKRIIRIIRDLKSFARIDPDERIGTVDLNREIESALGIAWNEIKYIAEVRNIPGTIPLIRGYAGELGQVILNIIVNAAQAIESQKRQDQGLIEMRTYRHGDFVRLTISDDGPGIPEGIISRIFDPFFTTKDPGKGTGLGLNISYDIVVNRHGGHLEVASVPDKGTTFTIDLPLEPSNQHEQNTE